MPPFEYVPFNPAPYAASIGELLARQNDPAARAAIATAEAQARAREITGQAWSGAARDIGHSLSGSIQQLTDPQRQIQQQTIQANALKLGAEQRQKAGQAAIAGLMTEPSGPQPDGAAPIQNPYLKQEGDVSVWDVSALSKAMAAKGYGDLTPSVMKDVGALNDAHRKEAMDRAQFAQSQANVVAKGAGTVLAMLRDHPNADPALLVDFIGQQLAANKIFPSDQIESTKQQLLSDPAHLVERLTALTRLSNAPAVKLSKDEVALNPNDLSGPPLASNIDRDEGGYTINGQRFRKNGTPVGATVPKQSEPPKLGSPEDFLGSYAKEKFGVAPSAMTVAQKGEALGAFKEANADQDLRAAALAQKNIATALAQMQINQQPTKDQAASVAEDLVKHRIAPEQLASLFSTRGKEGLAFKLAVTAEAKKMDPEFNFEQASSEYQLSKSSGFQNTVRYMDSALESIPRLEANAKNLGNGRFRSLNEIANATKNQFNSTDLKRFKTDALLVGDEVAKILSGGGTGAATSDAKLKQATDLIGVSDSVPAIAAAMEEIKALMGNRRRALTRGTYMEGMGPVSPNAGPSTPASLTPGLQKLRDR